MTRPRKTLVSLNQTPYYHCVSRCVRRAYLWGRDRHSGRDYSHRKAWVVERLATLAEVFAIDICAYAVMANHYHLVVRIDPERAAGWAEDEVIERWGRLFGLPGSVARQGAGQGLDAAGRAVVAERVAVWRSRLSDLSWFMRCLNEHLARRANAEDECRGRFWEGRFKCQALVDEAGLLTALAYVDLNPVRAGVAETPEQSDFTSIAERIRRLEAEPPGALPPSPALVPFRGQEKTDTADPLPYTLEDYLTLVDWTGRGMRPGKGGHIPANLPPLLERIRIQPRAWRKHMRPRGNRFGRAMGRMEALRAHARACGQRWIRGIGVSSRLFAQIG